MFGGEWRAHNYTNFNDWTDEASKDAVSYGNASVAKYGGFYISRYEAGWEDTETSKLGANQEYIASYDAEMTKKNETAISSGKIPISKPNVFAWNFISQTNAKTVSESMYKKNEEEGHANSYLVDGAAWDTITRWIAVDHVDVSVSNTYGNYIDNASDYTGWYAEHVLPSNAASNESTKWLYARYFTNGSIKLQCINLNNDNGTLWNEKKSNYTSPDQFDASEVALNTQIEIPTGSCDRFKLKNIYDLAGNMWEWTTEIGNHKTASSDGSSIASDGQFSVIRGGGFTDSGILSGLGTRVGTWSVNFANVDVGFRVVLYIK